MRNSELPETDEDTVEEHHHTEDILFKSSPYESRHPWIGEKRKCSNVMDTDPDSWLIYIPFDTCSFRFGGSLLAQVNAK